MAVDNMINQSINQPINQSSTQSITQTANEYVPRMQIDTHEKYASGHFELGTFCSCRKLSLTQNVPEDIGIFVRLGTFSGFTPVFVHYETI